MSTLTIKIDRTERVTQEVELSLPAFFKNKEGTELVGMFDESSVFEIVKDEYETRIRTFNNDKWGAGKDRLVEAYNKFHSCTESEFIENFDNVVASLFTNKKLAV